MLKNFPFEEVTPEEVRPEKMKNSRISLLDSTLFNEELLENKKFMILRDGERRGYWSKNKLHGRKRLQTFVIGEINHV